MSSPFGLSNLISYFLYPNRFKKFPFCRVCIDTMRAKLSHIYLVLFDTNTCWYSHLITELEYKFKRFTINLYTVLTSITNVNRIILRINCYSFRITEHTRRSLPAVFPKYYNRFSYLLVVSFSFFHSIKSYITCYTQFII